MRLDIYVNYCGSCEEAFRFCFARGSRSAGTVLMGSDIPSADFKKMEEKRFANRSVMLRDRFGTSWMLLHQPQPSP